MKKIIATFPLGEKTRQEKKKGCGLFDRCGTENGKQTALNPHCEFHLDGFILQA